VCSEGGLLWAHSIKDGWIEAFITGRLEVIASHMIKANIKIATTEVYLPIEETTFQDVKASG